MYTKIHHAVCNIDTDDYHATEWFRDRSGNEYETEMGVRAITNSGNHCLIKIGKNYYIAKRGHMKDSCIETYFDEHWHPDGYIQICNGDLKDNDRVWMKIHGGKNFEYGVEQPPKDPIRRLFFEAGLASNRDSISYAYAYYPKENDIDVMRDRCERAANTNISFIDVVVSTSGRSFASVRYEHIRGRFMPKMLGARFADSKPSIKEAKDLISQIFKYCNA